MEVVCIIFFCPRGYIVFDDYNDYEFSPEVRPMVDHIISTLNGYEIIGTLPNLFKADPESMLDGNCFIIRKKWNYQ